MHKAAHDLRGFFFKSGHCNFQTRPLGVKPGKYPRLQEQIGNLEHFLNVTGGITDSCRADRCPLWVISGQTIAGQNPPMSAIVQ